jgi:serine/threonine-protein kinase
MACLDDTTVIEFVSGGLPEAQRAHAEAHLADCADCRQLLSALAQASPSQIAPVSSPRAARPTPAATPPSATPDRGPDTFVVEPGAWVADRFQLVSLLGEGGMGSVWSARHKLTRRMVALKFLKGSSDGERKRMIREARAAAAIRHPNVLTVHDLIEREDGSPVLVMDLLEGESLRQRLAADGPLPVDELCQVLVPVVSAVGAAHALGIIHRDLKPDNIFLCQRTSQREVKVLDFGVAKLTATSGDAAHTASMTRSGEMLGTPYYMAPEQAFGELDLDHRVDVWAIGVIAYECLTGQRPFQGANLGQVLKAVMTGKRTPLAQLAPRAPRELVQVIERMLSSDRTQRPGDLRPVFDILRRHSDVAAPSFTGVRPTEVRGASTWPRRVLLTALALAALGAGLGLARRVAGPGRPGTVRGSPPPAPLGTPPTSRAIAPPPVAGGPPRELPASPPLVPPSSPQPATRHGHKSAPASLPGGVVPEAPF